MGKENLLAGHEIEKIEETFEINEKLIISEETYLKGFLEQARNVRQMAVKHMEKEPNEIIIQTSQIWKNKMARIGLEVQASGEKINLAFNKFQEEPFWNDETIRAEASKLWKKKMLPQLFKWNPSQKEMLTLNLDEYSILQKSSEFISDQLGLQIVQVLMAGEDEDEGSKSKFAFPLEPGVIFR